MLFLVLTVLAPTTFIYAANFVTLKAWASEEYLKERARDPEKKIQSYEFLEGHHFKGSSYDKGVQEMTVEELVYDLAQHLIKQDFYPNPIVGEGDLLIVVHYGVAEREENMMELLGIANESDLLDMNVSGTDLTVGDTASNAAFLDVMDTLVSTQSMTQALNSGGRMTRRQKAQILGLDSISYKPSHFTSNYEYQQMMRESRYFVVLMAFDYQRFLKKDETVLLWSTRYNIRTPGQSFETAIKEMNVIGGDYFGKNFDKLMRKRRDDDSRVEIGEIEVIGHVSPDTESDEKNP
jgi:hypothetical protein